MDAKPSAVTYSSAQEGRRINNLPSNSSNCNSNRSPLLTKTDADIFDFFNAGEQNLERGSRTVALKS